MATSRVTGTSEDVKTYKAAGGDYSDLAVWEAATDIDCVTGTTSPVLECDAEGSGHWDDIVDMAGATTNATYFRIIRPASGQGHSGISVVDGSAVSFSPSETTGDVIALNETYASIQDIIIRWTSNSANYDNGLRAYSANCKIIGVLVQANNAGSSTANAFSEDNAVTLFINCLAFESRDGFYTKAASLVYNCTSADNTDDGFDDNGSGGTFKNCLAWGNTGSDYETIGTSVTCGDEDGTGDFTLTGIPFVDAANDDYHLGVGEDGIDDGTDVSADGYGDDDVDKETRSGSWDVGFDEYVAAAAAGTENSISFYRTMMAQLSGSGGCSGIPMMVTEWLKKLFKPLWRLVYEGS